MGINEAIRIAVEFVGIDDSLRRENGGMDEYDHLIDDQFTVKLGSNYFVQKSSGNFDGLRLGPLLTKLLIR